MPRGYRHRQPRADAAFAADLQHAAKFVHAFANAEQPEMCARRVLRRQIEAAAIVFHDELRVVGAELQRDVDLLRRRMLDRIGQRLQPDAQEMMLGRRVEPLRPALDADLRARRRA